MATLLLYFFLDGKAYAFRNGWTAVPRIGDEILLGPEKQLFRVVRVVWGAENEREASLDRYAVNVVVERAAPQPSINIGGTLVPPA